MPAVLQSPCQASHDAPRASGAVAEGCTNAGGVSTGALLSIPAHRLCTRPACRSSWPRWSRSSQQRIGRPSLLADSSSYQKQQDVQFEQEPAPTSQEEKKEEEKVTYITRRFPTHKFATCQHARRHQRRPLRTGRAIVPTAKISGRIGRRRPGMNGRRFV